MTSDELKTLIQKQKKHADLALSLLLVFFTLPFIVAVFFYKEQFFQIVHPIAGIVVFVGVQYAVILILRNNIKRLGLVCPSCHKTLDKNLWELALTSKKCGNCGITIIED